LHLSLKFSLCWLLAIRFHFTYNLSSFGLLHNSLKWIRYTFLISALLTTAKSYKQLDFSWSQWEILEVRSAIVIDWHARESSMNNVSRKVIDMLLRTENIKAACKLFSNFQTSSNLWIFNLPIFFLFLIYVFHRR
jgi:hypothetical protein